MSKISGTCHQITYQFIDRELENSDKLDRAFDILFEEVLKEKDNLTTKDN